MKRVLFTPKTEENSEKNHVESIHVFIFKYFQGKVKLWCRESIIILQIKAKMCFRKINCFIIHVYREKCFAKKKCVVI